MKIELYEFDYGEAGAMRLNDSNVNVNVAGVDWEGVGISRRDLDQDVSEEQSNFSVRVPLPNTTDYVKEHVAGAVGGDIWLRVWEHEIGSGTRISIFEGIIIEWEMKGLYLEVKAAPMTARAVKSTIKVILTSGCVLRLYSGKCGVSKSTHQVYGTVDSIDEDDPTKVMVTITGSGIDVPPDLSTDPTFFSLGHILMGQESRMVNSYDYETGLVTLVTALSSGVVAGGNFFMWAGCDKRMATCKGRFDNLVRFLGFPYVPFDDAVFIGMKPETTGDSKK